MKFGPREALFFALILGLLGSAYWFGFRRLDAKRAGLEQQTAAKEAALANLRAGTAGIGDVERKIDELQQAIEFFEQKLPAQRQIAQILDEVTRLADGNGLKSDRFETLKVAREPNYSEQPIHMTLSGEFEGFYQYLLQLEKLPRITRVTNLTLEKIDARDGQMQAEMTLSIFFEPNAPTVDEALQ